MSSKVPPSRLPSVVAEMLQIAQLRADAPAFFHRNPQPIWVTWGCIAQWVASACDALVAADVRSGEHVASVADNSAQWFVYDFACQVLGLVHVAIDPRWAPPVIETLLEQSDSRLVYVHRNNADASRNFLPRTTKQLDWQLPLNRTAASPQRLEQLIDQAKDVQVDAPAQILFTSGTTGTPKAVLLSNRNLLSNARAKLDAAPQFEHDLRLNILPFCHAYARTCELSTWVLSASRLAIAPDWNQFLQMAREIQPTLVNLVPHLVRKIVQSAHAMPPTNEQSQYGQAQSIATKILSRSIQMLLGEQVRLLQVGGAALPDELWQTFADAGLPPLQGYGLTEASPVICSNRTGDQRPGTIGPAVEDVELQVDDQKQLWVRGSGVMLGYYRDETATRNRVRDGWLATGDLVETEPSGHYRIVGRLSDVIVLSTGFKVSPELIESRLAAIEWLERILVVGESQPCLSMLVWPAWEQLPRNLVGDSHAEFKIALMQRVANLLSDLPAFMHPRNFAIVNRPVDDPSLLNSKGTLRRQAAIEWFAQEISAISHD